MVKRGNNSIGENKFGEFNFMESYHGGGKVYYENLKEEKVNQQNTASFREGIDMPVDDSEYNTMFMTF